MAIGVYYLLVNIILNSEKLFDILLITKFFGLAILTVSFVFAVKIVKQKNNKLFNNQYRLILFFYAVNIFLLLLAAFLFLVIFKGLRVGFFLLSGSILLLYIYYYFSRLVYYIAFFGKLRRTMLILTAIMLVGYCLILILPQINYKKVYNETEVKNDFTYFHKLDIDAIANKRDLRDENSAKKLTELINLIAADAQIKDEGEKLSYVSPTEEELRLLSEIANNEYLSFSDEYLPVESRKTGTKLIVPLNNLRAFSRGVVKIAEINRSTNFEEEAIDMLTSLLFVGNQMLDAKNDTLIVRLVGDSMMRSGFEGLSVIYKNDNQKIDMINEKIKELDDIRNGQRLLRTAVFHMTGEIVGSSKNTAIFFKHLSAQKHNVGSNFDMMLLENNMSLIDGLITRNSTELEKSALSMIALPIMLPFELNIGNGYIIYRETKKLKKEPDHEMLDYYFKSNYSDFMKEARENEKKAEFISEKIFIIENSSSVDMTKSITDYLLTQEYFSWKTATKNHNFCVIENLDPSGSGLFPLYAWVRCGEFIVQNGKLKELSGKSAPAKINYPNELSFYDLSKFSYEAPRDGSLYLEDIKTIFPLNVQKIILNFDSGNLNKKIKVLALSNLK
ncbi:hypothetical protein KAR28_05565 [Candidatus Parcubacteria bacterium]|nr:hypothetical protein [Candidatus Parcubacteria bacterium]